MKYLICLLLFVGCTSEKPKPNPEIWEVENDCKRLRELLEGSHYSLEVKDSAYHKGNIVVCRISGQKDEYSNFYGREVEGAVRGIVNFHNTPLKKNLDKCMAKNQCSKFKFEYYVSCMYKCQEKVGWWK